MRRETQLILMARVVSALFTPFYLPIVGLIALFLFSYMSIFPLSYKIEVLAIVYLFTILLPTAMIRLYRHWQGYDWLVMGHRERRIIPYVISMLCYFACYYLMERMHLPHFLGAIVVAALMVQVVCAMINVWWKISTHTAAIGGVGGALFAFAEYLMFNPTWWLAVVFLLAGAVGTSRMILRQHTLSQVVGGFWVGFVAAAVAILYF